MDGKFKKYYSSHVFHYAEEISDTDFSEATPTESYRLYQEQIKTLRDLILSEKPKKIF